MAAEGFRVVSITYTYVSDPETAYILAMDRRSSGSRASIITEDEYLSTHLGPMQDLREFRKKHNIKSRSHEE